MRLRRHSGGEHESSTGIDLAPMLDFVINLLIFFIITAAFVTEAGIKVDRPSAKTATREDNANIFVAISAQGDIWIDRQHVDIRTLRATIERSSAEVVVSGTPIDLAALIGTGKPIVRARYEFAELDSPGLWDEVSARLDALGLSR